MEKLFFCLKNLWTEIIFLGFYQTIEHFRPIDAGQVKLSVYIRDSILKIAKIYYISCVKNAENDLFFLSLS